MKKGIIVLLILVLIGCFYKISELNGVVFKQIKENVVHHPDSLPNSTLAKVTSFWFKNARADFYRLEAIQYIWGNVLSAEYKKYLYKMLDLITDLNPYFEWPYFIWELLLPSFNYRYENLEEKEQDIYAKQGRDIWLKWVANMCDRKKLELIKKEDDLTKLWTWPMYQDPCKSVKIPYFLAYMYYFSFSKPETSSYFYKVTSAIKDSFKWAKIMAAVMQWKSGNREKSVFMFLNLSRSLDDEDKECLKFWEDLEKYMFEIDKGSLPLDGKFITNISKISTELFGEFDEKNEEDFLEETKCSSYINKAIREINLLYLERANTKYLKDTGKNAKDGKELFNHKYIDILPKDFQQYKEKGYGVEYFFDEKTWKFDFEVNYPE